MRGVHLQPLTPRVVLPDDQVISSRLSHPLDNKINSLCRRQGTGLYAADCLMQNRSIASGSRMSSGKDLVRHELGSFRQVLAFQEAWESGLRAADSQFSCFQGVTCIQVNL